MKAIGWALIAAGVAIIVFRRIAGIELTEGQLFVQDLPWWLAALGCVAGGVNIIQNAKGESE